MQDKICLITGANAGLGRATALALARQGARVVMVCRDKARGEAARDEVRGRSGNREVELMLCDLASLASIRSFVEQFRARYDRLHALVNNAGLALPERRTTVDGFEMVLGVNHLGHFALTLQLLEALRAGAPSRIVNVSSYKHGQYALDFDNLQLERGYSMLKSYAHSKLCNVLFTYELARRLEGTGVTANCVHPGAAATSINANSGAVFLLPAVAMLMAARSLGFLTPEEGAVTQVWAASAPELEGVSGKYFGGIWRKCQEERSSKSSYDVEAARKLWEYSERVTGVSMSPSAMRG